MAAQQNSLAPCKYTMAFLIFWLAALEHYLKTIDAHALSKSNHVMRKQKVLCVSLFSNTVAL